MLSGCFDDLLCFYKEGSMKQLKVVLFIFAACLLAACSPFKLVVEHAVAKTQTARTPIPPIPSQTPYPTLTSYPTQTEAIITQVFIWTPTYSNNNCKPISKMDYSDRSKMMVDLQAYVSELPDVRSVSYVIPERLYNNSTSESFHVTFVSSSDGKVYSKRYIVYVREFGWKNAVFSIDGQCWIDPPH
jgi:hypothetical protein